MSIKQISEEYRLYLQSDKWRQIRQQIIDRDGGQCRICGGWKNLQVHHITGKYRFYEESHPETLMTLCDRCHEGITQYYNEVDRLKIWAEKLRKQ